MTQAPSLGRPEPASSLCIRRGPGKRIGPHRQTTRQQVAHSVRPGRGPAGTHRCTITLAPHAGCQSTPSRSTPPCSRRPTPPSTKRPRCMPRRKRGSSPSCRPPSCPRSCSRRSPPGPKAQPKASRKQLTASLPLPESRLPSPQSTNSPRPDWAAAPPPKPAPCHRER